MLIICILEDPSSLQQGGISCGFNTLESKFNNCNMKNAVITFYQYRLSYFALFQDHGPLLGKEHFAYDIWMYIYKPTSIVLYKGIIVTLPKKGNTSPSW